MNAAVRDRRDVKAQDQAAARAGQQQVAILFVHGMSNARWVDLSNKPLRFLLRRALRSHLPGFDEFGEQILVCCTRTVALLLTPSDVPP